MPLSLDDEGMEAVLSLARPLSPAERGGFLQALALELEASGAEPGVGLIYRVGRELQRRFRPGETVARGPTPHRDRSPSGRRVAKPA